MKESKKKLNKKVSKSMEEIEITIEIGFNLRINILDNLLDEIKQLRANVLKKDNYQMPLIRVIGTIDTEYNSYKILIDNKEQLLSQLEPKMVLVEIKQLRYLGLETNYWIEKNKKNVAIGRGYKVKEPTEIIIEELTEILNEQIVEFKEKVQKTIS